MCTAGIVALAEVRLATESGHARAVRQAARVSQSEVARNVGVSQASVSRWEAGDRVPHGKAAQRYAKVLRALEEAVA
jgi:DNA-binding transcriptional regulator YiaG